MTLSERKKNLHGKGSKKGQDKLKDKKQIIFMQNSISCHIYKVERVHRMGLLFVLHGNRTNCHQQQYETDTCFVSVESG